jgi:NAD(P)-dependent dehydrogenase (short-subunit alcohol dehydrogenase family)
MKNADRRIALVTGGNRGLGLQTARELVSQDIHVILGCRDYKKGETVVSGPLSIATTEHVVGQLPWRQPTAQWR